MEIGRERDEWECIYAEFTPLVLKMHDEKNESILIKSKAGIFVTLLNFFTLLNHNYSTKIALLDLKFILLNLCFGQKFQKFS